MTSDHCEFLKKRLDALTHHREERCKDFLHSKKIAHAQQVEGLKTSIRS